jgi:hypothetical protein
LLTCNYTNMMHSSLILKGQPSVSTSHLENGPLGAIYQALKNLENTAGEPRKIRVLNEGRGCQIQRPRGDHATARSNLRLVLQTHVALILLGVGAMA